MSGIDRRGEGIREALAGEQPATIPARTIGEEWASFRSARQVEECKRAFYAGAHAMYCATLAAAGHPDDAVCDARMDTLGREMSDYLRLFTARESV